MVTTALKMALWRIWQFPRKVSRPYIGWLDRFAALTDVSRPVNQTAIRAESRPVHDAVALPAPPREMTPARASGGAEEDRIGEAVGDREDNAVAAALSARRELIGLTRRQPPLFKRRPRQSTRQVRGLPADRLRVLMAHGVPKIRNAVHRSR